MIWLFLFFPFSLVAGDFFIVFLVEAPHLNYTNNYAFLRTIAKHPSNGSKNGDFGHAWIHLQGIVDGQPVVIEGGHSGELGIVQAKYFDGIMDAIERNDPNPIKYLWEEQRDGFFQQGSGGHRPTYAVKVELSQVQFERVLDFIRHYPYSHYSLTENQCSTFVAQIAALIDLPLQCQLTMSINQTLVLRGETFLLWTDPRYSQITFGSPDVIERSLKAAVKQHRALPIRSGGYSCGP